MNKQIIEVYIKIGAKKIKFNKKTIQWLGIWLDNQLKFSVHVNKKLQKTEIAEIQIKSLMKTYALAPALIRRIQIQLFSLLLYTKRNFSRKAKKITKIQSRNCSISMEEQ